MEDQYQQTSKKTREELGRTLGTINEVVAEAERVINEDKRSLVERMTDETASCSREEKIRLFIKQYQNKKDSTTKKGLRAEELVGEIDKYIMWVDERKQYISPADDLFVTLKNLSDDLNRKVNELKHLVIRASDSTEMYGIAINLFENMLT